MARGQKKARQEGMSIAFLDESGFMLQPFLSRSWAPKGKTPVVSCWQRHDRISAISAITLAPRYERFGLYFRLYSSNITFEEVKDFLRQLHYILRRKILLVLDNYSAHKKALRLLTQEHPDWFEVEWLPGYAPDLNPVEGVWGHTKCADLANFPFEDVSELGVAVSESLGSLRHRADLLRSFFKCAGLEI